MKKIWTLIMASALLWGGCSKEYVSEYDRISSRFEQNLDGEIDPIHFWKTAVTLQVKVISDHRVTIYAYNSVEGKNVLYDYKELERGGTVLLTIPQGMGNSFTLSCADIYQIHTERITLDGRLRLTTEVEMPALVLSSTQITRPETRTFTPPNSLYGHSIAPHTGYQEFDVNHWRYIADLAYTTSNPLEAGEICNYELISKGRFNIVMLAGFAGTQDQRILGYYTHSRGRYDDMEFTDLTETHYIDYIASPNSDNYLCKTQYQLDNVDQWYDANFDYRDGFDPPYTIRSERLNDDAYNTLFVNRRYTTRVTRMRGLSFEIDVPVGKRIGFYLRMPSRLNTKQQQQLINLGIPNTTLKANFGEANFSAMVFNTDQKHRSMVKVMDGYAFMGMEDEDTKGDYDCNDVMFGIAAQMEYEMPEVVQLEDDETLKYDHVLPWTLAYEDVARGRDFDFNDVVIRVTPDFENETAKVVLCAAGSPYKMNLHYNGPEGDVDLGEVHQLFGEKAERCINTLSSRTEVDEITVAHVPWPLNYTMQQDADRFYLTVQRGNCIGCDEMITFNSQPGLMPQAILVAGTWCWPKEQIPIFTTYSEFASWGKDYCKTAYWSWYSYPKSNTYVTP